MTHTTEYFATSTVTSATCLITFLVSGEVFSVIIDFTLSTEFSTVPVTLLILFFAKSLKFPTTPDFVDFLAFLSELDARSENRTSPI